MNATKEKDEIKWNVANEYTYKLETSAREIELREEK